MREDTIITVLLKAISDLSGQIDIQDKKLDEMQKTLDKIDHKTGLI